MEKDTVTISLDHYNELRDFKTNIEAGNTVRVYTSPCFDSLNFISTSDALEEMNEVLQQKNKEINDLKNQLATKTKQPRKWYQILKK